jgi:syntaxin 1B/2/3
MVKSNDLSTAALNKVGTVADMVMKNKVQTTVRSGLRILALPSHKIQTEMQNLNGQSSGRDPNAILNECREIDKGIDRIQGNLDRLRDLQDRSLNDTRTEADSPTNQALDTLNADTISLYRSFVGRMKNIKSNPESGNPRNSAQVGRVDRRLKEVINQYQQVERDYRRKVQEARERSYRIVRPDASDAEVREAMDEPANSQIFSQAVRCGLYDGRT